MFAITLGPLRHNLITFDYDRSVRPALRERLRTDETEFSQKEQRFTFIILS